MLWGAVLGYFIVGGYLQIERGWWHQGPGVVSYETGDRKVSEEQFKRDHYGGGGLLFGLGLMLWFFIAKKTENDEAERGAGNDYLNARIETQNIYCASLAKVMGASTYQAAAAEAMKDPAYQATKATEETKRLVHYVASKDAKGET